MPTIHSRQEGKLLHLTLDNPPLNQLHSSLLKQLEEIIARAQDNPEVRVIIISGAGSRAFSAGADIKEFPEVYGQGRLQATLTQRHNLLRSLEYSKKPIIAALNGLTLGGGLELAMSCHFRLASEGAILALPEVDLGIIPGWAGTQRMTRLLGSSKALEIMLTGRRLTAHEALELGLVSAVLGLSSFPGKVYQWADKLAEKAPLAVAGILQSVARYNEAGFEAGCAMEREWSEKVSQSADAMEGIASFIQKRKPDFKGQ